MRSLQLRPNGGYWQWWRWKLENLIKTVFLFLNSLRQNYLKFPVLFIFPEALKKDGLYLGVVGIIGLQFAIS